MIHFEIPKNQSSIIKVIGVGGGGSNAVNYMYDLGIDGVDFIVCNTDSQALALSPIPNKIQLGPHLTQGLGAGANPEIGMKASEESLDDITKILKVNTRMAFITAGMGGGTGTGGAPVVSKICRELGILTVGIVTMPFSYEGRKRMKQAQEGIERMRDHVDTILIISNDKLRQQFGNLPFTQAFAKADDILATAAKCITDVINTTGQINVDFADVCTVMKNGGVAILGSATVSGETRALEAVELALSSPLLNDNDISGAKWILLNITSSAGEFEHTMDEAEAIQAFVQQQAGDGCDVILGMGHDPNLGDKIAVTIIATGFNHRELKTEMPARKNEPEKIVVSLNEPVQIVAAPQTSELKIELKEKQPDHMTPQLVEMPQATTASTHVEKVQQPIIPVIDEVKETYNLQVYEKPAPQEERVEAPVASASAPVAQQATVATAKPEEKDIQLIIKGEEAKQEQPAATATELKAPSGRPLTEWELEEKRRFEEQKRALEERAERLRSLSFNTRKSDTPEDMENVPAYMRRNLNLDDKNAPKNGSTDNFYSSYSVGTNGQPGKGFIQTINTFLDGKKPD